MSHRVLFIEKVANKLVLKQSLFVIVLFNLFFVLWFKINVELNVIILTSI